MIKNVQITNGIAIHWTGKLDSFSDMVHLFNATLYSQISSDEIGRHESDLYGYIYVMTGTGEKIIEIDDFVILKNDGSIVVCKPDMLEEMGE